MGLELVIVDDAAFIREAIRSVAERENFSIVGEAVDGDEAVRLVLALKPDVVILDLVLPKKNGIEVTKEILAENSKIKILACSTESQREMVLQAINAGCKEFLAKPFTTAQLIEKIRTVAALN